MRMYIILGRQMDLHSNLPSAFRLCLHELLSICAADWATGPKKLWLTCRLMLWIPAFTDWLLSLFLSLCLSTQAMQVKVQVKCMMCLFCPSIRGATLCPPPHCGCPGKTTACPRVNAGLSTLGMGKPGKPCFNWGLLAISAPFPKCLLS